MKVIMTNKEDCSVKVVYKQVTNAHVASYINPDCGYDGTPHWILELPFGFDTASFKCSEWEIEVV